MEPPRKAAPGASRVSEYTLKPSGWGSLRVSQLPGAPGACGASPSLKKPHPLLPLASREPLTTLVPPAYPAPFPPAHQVTPKASPPPPARSQLPLTLVSLQLNTPPTTQPHGAPWPCTAAQTQGPWRLHHCLPWAVTQSSPLPAHTPLKPSLPQPPS